MGSPFIDIAFTVNVPVCGGEETVAIKPSMSYGDNQALQDRIVQIDADNNRRLLPGQYNLALLELNIVKWSFKDDRGKPIPVTPANIYRLNPRSDVAERVLAEIERRNPASVSNTNDPDPNDEPTGSASGLPTPSTEG